MFDQQYYFQTIRKYVVAFASIFDNVQIQRFDTNNEVIKLIDVPIHYIGKRKFFEKMSRSTIAVSTILPRMGFTIDSMTYDPSRKLSNTSTIVFEIDDENRIEKYNHYCNPYTFNFTLTVFAKNSDDMLQIVEQATSYFNPDRSLSVIEMPEFGFKRDIIVQLDNVNLSITTDFAGDSNNDRVVTADLKFTLLGYVYPPIKDSAMIEKIKVYFKEIDTTKFYEGVKVTFDSLENKINTDLGVSEEDMEE